MEHDLSKNRFMMGGNGTAVQVGETAFCRGRIIQNPTSSYDNIPNVTWLVGVKEETSDQRVVLKIVPDRAIYALKSFLESVIMPGTLVKTDGFPSYHRVIRDIGCIHSVVNHLREYVNDVGDHTNLIENLCKHLKTEYHTRRGIMNENIPQVYS
ncbi:hypothetical protein NGRA_2153 [Nosema granulosis]|uniref:ISXO2-like transposase domain-containing protein n=1 Tax=Nosema granulosis TaxID=83296 RepID=A0A9P6GX96_9MICR|nr:hypothetical protein NGRA_2153 [Nosema granulosis]